MYLFSRRARLAGGNGRAGIEWALDICERVRQVTDLDLHVWATTFSPGWGTLSFSAFVPDLQMLESAGDKLMVDDGFMHASDVGAGLTVGGLDDSLMEILHGSPDPRGDAQYVAAVQAVCATGNIGKGMLHGIEIAKKAEAVTGHPTLFGRSVTGPYSGVGWLTGFTDIASLEASQRALAADPEWPNFLDRSASGVYAEDVAATRATIHRRMA
jgi:hypothetical protein